MGAYIKSLHQDGMNSKPDEVSGVHSVKLTDELGLTQSLIQKRWSLLCLHDGAGWSAGVMVTTRSYSLNSLWHSDVKWWHRSGSTLAQVMACCLTAPGHYLNQCWLIISEVLWHLPEGNSTTYTHDINLQDEFENHTFLKLLPQLPGANELTKFCLRPWCMIADEAHTGMTINEMYSVVIHKLPFHWDELLNNTWSSFETISLTHGGLNTIFVWCQGIPEPMQTYG